MKQGDCGTCKWFEPQKDQSGKPVTGAGFCFESPPHVMLLPMQVQATAKVLTAGQPQTQQGYGLQSVYPVVAPDQRCSKYIPILSH